MKRLKAWAVWVPGLTASLLGIPESFIWTLVCLIRLLIDPEWAPWETDDEGEE